jgi:hypothetical protein
MSPFSAVFRIAAPSLLETCQPEHPACLALRTLHTPVTPCCHYCTRRAIAGNVFPPRHCRLEEVCGSILRSCSSSTLAILSRQEGRRSRTIDELSQSPCSRRRTSHAAPARRDHPGLGALCATVFAPGLAPRAALAPGCDPHAWCTYRHGRLGDGVGSRAPPHQRPSGVEPGHVVGAPGQPNLVGPPHHWPRASGSAYYAGSRRHSW